MTDSLSWLRFLRGWRPPQKAFRVQMGGPEDELLRPK